MHYDIKFMDGEIKKNIPSVRMRKLEGTSKPPPRPATGTGTRVMTSHSASRPMSAAAVGSYKAPKRKAMTFAAWKRGGASSIYGHGSGMKYRPSTVPLNGTSEMRRVYKPTHSGRTGRNPTEKQRPSSAVARSAGAKAPYSQTMKDRPHSAGVLRGDGRANTNISTGSPLPIQQKIPNTTAAVSSMKNYNAQSVDPFMRKLMSAIYLDKPADVAGYVLNFTQNYIKNRPNLVIGASVVAKCDGWTEYYPGKVVGVNSDATYDIQFDNGTAKSNVKEHQIKEEQMSQERETYIARIGIIIIIIIIIIIKKFERAIMSKLSYTVGQNTMVVKLQV